jgi:cell division protein FtsN
VNAAQLHELLAKSGFTAPVTSSDYGKDRAVVGGPPMSSATDLRYAQDRVDTVDHQGVVRELFEDHRSPDEIYVHLFMFTT